MDKTGWKAAGLIANRARVDLGITQAVLAERIGHKPAWLSRVEDGAILPTPADVSRLARMLGLADEVWAHLLFQWFGISLTRAEPLPTPPRLMAECPHHGSFAVQCPHCAKVDGGSK